MADTAKPAVAAYLWHRLRTPTLLVVPREVDADAALEALRAWVGDAALPFPARPGLSYAREEPAADVTRRRLVTLAQLAQSGGDVPPPLVVASVAAVSSSTARPADLGAGGRVAVGDRLGIDALAARLVAAGYELGPLVERAGQAARRGGLLDAYPPTEALPVRIELFGNEIESIRRFDPETQRTTERIEAVRIGPAHEWFPAQQELIALADAIAPARASRLEERTEDELAALRRGELPAPGRYGPLAAEATLLDHLSAGALVIVDETDAVRAAAAEQDALTTERRALLAEQGSSAATRPCPTWPSRR